MSAPNFAHRPRLSLGHATLAARDLDRLSAFYCDVLGFVMTNRGPAGPDSELVFLSANIDNFAYTRNIYQLMGAQDKFRRAQTVAQVLNRN